jgi:deoxyribonuclease-1
MMRGEARRMVLGLVLALLAVWPNQSEAQPRNFEDAKELSRKFVYHDRATAGDTYCGCEWRWVGRSGGRVDHSSCGYQVRAQPVRAARIEHEHVVPASSFGSARQCWQQGGRQNCRRTDPVFNQFEGDLHNLTIVVGEVNADRSNYRFGVLPGVPLQHGACPFRVDFAGRVAEPPDQAKGMVARQYFYVSDRYNLRMSEQQQRLFMAWDRAHPPTDWEIERDRRIARVMGWNNPFVTGERTWGDGRTSSPQVERAPAAPPARAAISINSAAMPVRGNRRSGVYHLPEGCPAYNQVSPSNVVEFRTAAEAEAAGYRRAGNCFRPEHAASDR